jgi:hypothetical protein
MFAAVICMKRTPANHVIMVRCFWPYCVLHFARHTSHVTRHTSHVTRQRFISHRVFSSPPEHAIVASEGVEHWTVSHEKPCMVNTILMRHTSHITLHTSHVTRHTSHVTRITGHTLLYGRVLALAMLPEYSFKSVLNFKFKMKL